MKSKDVLRLLNVSRVTLMSYVKSGKISATKLPNGLYNYHDDSVYAFLKKDLRSNVLYARVSTSKQKNDLTSQVSSLVSYCKKNNITYSTVYKDVSSGIDLDRKEFSKLLDDVFNHKIKNVYITYKDRISRLSFKTLQQIFSKFGTNIVVINDSDKKSVNSDKELFEELISLIHYFSTKTYSHRRKSKLALVEDDFKLFQ